MEKQIEDNLIELADSCGLVYAGKNDDGELEFIGTDEQHESFAEAKDCDHDCTSQCRRTGCNCLCGEYHLITK